jgi:hypothetical protein
LLFLVAPALHVHPATDALLRYVSPEIEWTVVGIDERWRDGIRAVFRKRPGRSAMPVSTGKDTDRGEIEPSPAEHHSDIRGDKRLLT